MGKWFTFAPCNFVGNEGFFWRDSGLLCRGLQQLGHESKVILLGPAFEGDLPGIVRAEKRELESAEWWRALKLDGVVMMAWGRHRETPMVRAIAASGTPLVLHIDGNGNGFPLFDQVETLKTFWRAERGTGRAWPVRCAGFVTTATTQGIKLLLRHTYLKYRHLRYPTVVTLQTPISLERHEKFCSFFGGKNHGVRLKLAGCHIPSTFEWNPSVSKEKRVISIGRWEDLKAKRAHVLMPVCAAIARKHQDLHIDIFGTKTEALANWHRGLEPGLRERVHLHGVQAGPVVFGAAQKAQISFIPSPRESVCLSLFETLACGASTVGLDSPELTGTRWAADSHHAELAEHDTTEAFVAALDRGLKKWESGEYSARQISEFWVPKTRVRRVLQIMLNAVAEATQPRQHGCRSDAPP